MCLGRSAKMAQLLINVNHSMLSVRTQTNLPVELDMLGSRPDHSRYYFRSVSQIFLRDIPV